MKTRIIWKLQVILILICLMGILIINHAIAQHATHYEPAKRLNVITNKLNVRKGSGEDFEIVGSLKKGDVVALEAEIDLGRKGKWGHIIEPIKGWINTKYLKQELVMPKGETLWVISYACWVYSEPKIGPKVGKVERGACLRAVDVGNGWSEIFDAPVVNIQYKHKPFILPSKGERWYVLTRDLTDKLPGMW